MTIEEWEKDFKSFINELQMPRDDYKGILEYINDGVALLKEQEPVKPKPRNPHLGAWWYECGNCDKAISPGDNYCRGCGRAIDWSK